MSSNKKPSKDSSEELLPQQVGEYTMEKVIGQGTYGKVRLGIHNETDEKVAIKVIEKCQIQSPKQVARLQREIRFLKLLHHPNIVKVIDVIETQEFIYIIMEFAIGGELFDYIVANKRVKEREARHFFRMVLSAIDYCHQNAIIHRDLKPENLLLDDKKNIKIIDFGFGNNFTINGLLDTFCGSPFYAAPEMILGKKYEGPEVDMWSLGVILFALLCGHLPFDDDNMKELYKKIASGTYKCPGYVEPSARHLIDRLITVDPKKRATLKEVLQHEWVNEGYESPPQNYIPERPVIKDAALLSKDIIHRLEIFGYTLEEILKAFDPSQDFSLPNAIRATYFLLDEMVKREQTRLRALRKLKQEKLEAAKKINSNPNFESNATLAAHSESNLSLGGSNLSLDPKESSGIKTLYKGYDRNSVARRVPTQRPASFLDFQRISTGKTIPIETLSLKDNTPHPWRNDRRQSEPAIHANPSKLTNRNVSTTEKLKEDLRTVSGWFLNYSTTSNKPFNEILDQIKTSVGNQTQINFTSDSKCIVQTEIDINDFENHPQNQIESQRRVKPQTIQIQIEISKVLKTNLYNIQLKRVAGGIWNYKKVCNKLLTEINA
ncbi:kinase-like domain-containing protein [Globomyces pollinis-pini]|nr:kinase-like domain-containing protein [Globomyces pollinis-pini]KAJ2996445.1 Map microtubule affinity-regulating kinase [Globomyces sp. JEL0801]